MTKEFREVVFRVGRGRASEEGQVLVEYSLILGLVVLVAVTLLSSVGNKAAAMLSQISAAF